MTAGETAFLVVDCVTMVGFILGAAFGQVRGWW